MPSREAFLHLRSRLEEFTYRRHDSKEKAKVDAESYQHVKTLKDTLEEVFRKHPSLRTNPEAIINVDECEVATAFGERSKSLVPNSSRNGECKQKIIGSDKHVTAVIAASAAGRLAPPFFVVAGKNTLSFWTEPLDIDGSSLNESCKVYTRKNWFDPLSALYTTPNGSMECTLIHLVISHINIFFRKFVPPADPILVLLDGHSSRNGLYWLLKAVEYRIEIVKAPANTSHFLQPCDQSINKSFKRHVRKMRDLLVRCYHGIATGKPKFKLICASYALRCISANDVRASFGGTGLWPTDMRFLDRFQTPRQRLINSADDEK